MNKQNTISIVICTKDRLKEPLNCVNSIINQTHLPNSIIIVDGNDSNDLKNELTKVLEHIDINYIHIGQKIKSGLTGARNLSILHAKDDYILFLDDDVILDNNYIKFILEVYSSNGSEVGGVQGLITNAEPNRLRTIFTSLFLLKRNPAGKVLRSGIANYPYVNEMIQVDWLSGSNMCYRKKILAEYKFDEALKGYGALEDVDFSYRVSKKYKLYIIPKAKLIHEHTHTGRISIMDSNYMSIVNHFYFFKKNCKTNLIDYLFFFWSHIGIFMTYFVYLVINKDIKQIYAAIGFFKGETTILKNILRQI